jgi:hypothetical protein
MTPPAAGSVVVERASLLIGTRRPCSRRYNLDVAGVDLFEWTAARWVIPCLLERPRAMSARHNVGRRPLHADLADRHVDDAPEPVGAKVEGVNSAGQVEPVASVVGAVEDDLERDGPT